MANLLTDVPIHQEWDCHHFGTGHTPVRPGFQGAGTQDKRPVPAVGRRRRAKPIKVSAPGDPKPNKILHPIPTPQPPQSRRPKLAQVSLKRAPSSSRSRPEIANEGATKAHNGGQDTPAPP